MQDQADGATTNLRNATTRRQELLRELALVEQQIAQVEAMLAQLIADGRVPPNTDSAAA